MASTYADNTGLELIRNGEQSGTWGTTTNTNLSIIDRLTNGVVTISLQGLATKVITTSDGVLSEGQFKVIVFTGSPTSNACTVTISPPTNKHVYMIYNNTNGAVTVTQGSGGNVIIPAVSSSAGVNILYCDGGGSGAAVVSLSDNLSLSNVRITGGNIADGMSTSDKALARTGLDLEVGGVDSNPDVQAYDANLTTFLAAFNLPTSTGTAGQAITTDGNNPAALGFTSIASAARAYTYSVLF